MSHVAHVRPCDTQDTCHASVPDDTPACVPYGWVAAWSQQPGPGGAALARHGRGRRGGRAARGVTRRDVQAQRRGHRCDGPPCPVPPPVEQGVGCVKGLGPTPRTFFRIKHPPERPTEQQGNGVLLQFPRILRIFPPPGSGFRVFDSSLCFFQFRASMSLLALTVAGPTHGRVK